MTPDERIRTITTLNFIGQTEFDPHNELKDIALEYDNEFRCVYRDGGKLVYYINNRGMGDAEVGFLTMLVNTANENLTINNNPGKIDLALLLQDLVKVDGRQYASMSMMTHYILHTQIYDYLAKSNQK